MSRKAIQVMSFVFLFGCNNTGEVRDGEIHADDSTSSHQAAIYQSGSGQIQSVPMLETVGRFDHLLKNAPASPSGLEASTVSVPAETTERKEEAADGGASTERTVKAQFSGALAERIRLQKEALLQGKGLVAK